MSVVTNIMITGLLMADEREIFVSAMRKLTDPYKGFTPVDFVNVAGPMDLEGSIFPGAFNYLDLGLLNEALKDAVSHLEPHTVENMQIFIKGDLDDKWKVYDLQEYVEDYHPDCQDFERGENNGDCETTGHFLCKFCKHKLLKTTTDMMDFDGWFDIFTDECRNLGYNGPIDRDAFEDEFNNGDFKEPEEAAKDFVLEMMP